MKSPLSFEGGLFRALSARVSRPGYDDRGSGLFNLNQSTAASPLLRTPYRVFLFPVQKCNAFFFPHTKGNKSFPWKEWPCCPERSIPVDGNSKMMHPARQDCHSQGYLRYRTSWRLNGIWLRDHPVYPSRQLNQTILTFNIFLRNITVPRTVQSCPPPSRASVAASEPLSPRQCRDCYLPA